MAGTQDMDTAQIDILEQRHDMARAGLFHRLFKPRQGTNVNHGQIMLKQVRFSSFDIGIGGGASVMSVT